MTTAKFSIRKKLFFITLTLVSLSILFSCTTGPLSGTTKITDIIASPSKYADGLVSGKCKVIDLSRRDYV